MHRMCARFASVLFVCLVVVGRPAFAETSSPSDSESDAALVAAAEELISEKKTEPTKEESAASAHVESAHVESVNTVTAGTKDSQVSASASTQVPSESEIPAFATTEKVKKSQNSLLVRLAISLLVLVGGVGGVLIASKRWAKVRSKGGQGPRIEMLHQFALGPRRSLGLIRVAGEVLLLGITDHQVNLIKSIALVDDELEGVFKGDLNGFLEDEFTIQDMRSALEARS